MNDLFTIGYSPHSLESFLETIQKHRINAVVDVRSMPFSRFKPEFNRDTLSDFLKTKDIKYVFLGNECGARFDDPNCYKNGKANYKLISKHQKFQKGLKRIKKGLKEYSITLMCAEKDPIKCHRMILICRNLKNINVNINHIIDTDNLETQEQSEKRLLKLFKLDQPDLFMTEKQRLDLAYDSQSEIIAFSEESDRTNSIYEGNAGSDKN